MQEVDIEAEDFILACRAFTSESNLADFEYGPLVFPLRHDEEAFAAIRAIHASIARGPVRMTRTPYQRQNPAADTNPRCIIAGGHGLTRLAPEEHQRNDALFLGHADKRLTIGHRTS